ncbi:putative catechol O-methyltransferase 1 [Wickerhamomyces ciferrii]|uniref:catechol O-methyltransferase n=1 Tax=Wickerhamomyces ciferrii (strain ATCC 14091 / BCRC 22168 / CBS 111 / JCM 3599 / NBRC 0793 / NRRL Y-1031 F-60-10) TaxID=1206466 RepID=K0KJB9_WICCF|nr:putative catechol O-methyltransferase 1 [Wickerhamomyces ciferrii]CCH41584.1 putative catechol O-methyltransferase 1 [Wickerhamomyces ciferrii]
MSSIIDKILSEHDSGLSNEIGLFKKIRNQSDLQGNPQAILDAIDDYGTSHRIINIGAHKGKLLTDHIKETEPEVIVEFGTHTGYSSILMAKQLDEIGSSTSKIYTFEANETMYELSKEIVKLSGLQHRIVQVLGKAGDKLDTLSSNFGVDRINLLFIDHWKFSYLPDLRVAETLGYITKGSTLFADNIIYPGAPEYTKYVKAPPIYKNEYNTNNINPNGRNYVGKWNLLYESETVESTNGVGRKDAVEITKCVGILDS